MSAETVPREQLTDAQANEVRRYNTRVLVATALATIEAAEDIGIPIDGRGGVAQALLRLDRWALGLEPLPPWARAEALMNYVTAGRRSLVGVVCEIAVDPAGRCGFLSRTQFLLLVLGALGWYQLPLDVRCELERRTRGSLTNVRRHVRRPRIQVQKDDGVSRPCWTEVLTDPLSARREICTLPVVDLSAFESLTVAAECGDVFYLTRRRWWDERRARRGYGYVADDNVVELPVKRKPASIFDALESQARHDVDDVIAE